MENLNQIAHDILRIFEIVCVISDEKELFYEEFDILLDNLTLAKQLISNIKLDTIIDEIEDYNFNSDRVNEIIDLVNDKFDKLITWKPNIKSILEMNDKLMEDLKRFYKRQACIDHEYNLYEISEINSLYKEIGQRAHKLDDELIFILSDFFKRIKSEKLEQGVISEQFTLKLNPEKVSHFACLLTKMNEQNFFKPTNKENSITDFDVLFAFAELFKCDLINHYLDRDESNYTPTPIFEDSNNSEQLSMPASETSNFTGKPFPEYLLHPDKIKLANEIKKEFSTEKGKAIRLLLHVLEKNNPPFITIGYRQAKEVHIAMSDFFGRNIGKYQSVFDYKVDLELDQKELEKISVRLNHILSKL